jgi:hypothetical protein
LYAKGTTVFDFDQSEFRDPSKPLNDRTIHGSDCLANGGKLVALGFGIVT